MNPTAENAAETAHLYGPRLHLLEDPFMAAVLSAIGAPEMRAPAVLQHVRTAYRLLLARAAAVLLPAVERAVPTRMRAKTPAGVWRGRALDPRAEVVIANVLRAGNLPSLVCFEELSALLEPDHVRVDHFYLSRRANAAGHVVGVDSAGAKVGGSIAGRHLLIPDPMGATGSTTLRTLQAYRELDAGQPAQVIALHLMVTPEYVRRVLAETDDVVIWAGRLDRGKSPADVLATRPGTHPDRESGLDQNGYIVPGAGGLGEVLTNAWC